MGTPNVPARILQMLPCLRSRALTTLTIDMLINTYVGAPLAEDWGRLDRALATTPESESEKLEFGVELEETHAQMTLTFVSRAREVVELPRYMPLAAARGVLRVVLEKAR